MARNVYSLRIYASGGLTSSTGKVGPLVPAGLVYVVRDVDALEITATRPAELFLYGQVGVPLVNFLLSSADLSGNASWRGRQVYNEGEQVGLQATSGTWSVAVSGYQLSLP